MSRSSLCAFGGWALFVGWCLWGIPPCVDLPAHGAQLQTLAELIRGTPEVVALYRWTLPIGYGLPTLLFVPVALCLNGGVAVKVATWLSLVLVPVAVGVLGKALGQKSWWSAAVSATFAFNISYWYGFVHTLFAVPLVLFFWARLRRREVNSWEYLARAVLALAVMLSHFVMFAPLVVGAVALTRFDRRELRRVALALTPALVVGVGRITELGTRAVAASSDLNSQWDIAGHFNWVFRASPQMGRVDVTICWVIVSLVLAVAVARRRPGTAWWLFGSQLLLYVITPKVLAGAWLLYPRLAVLLAVSALVLVDGATLRPAVRFLTLALSVGGLTTTAARHVSFTDEVAGLEALARTPPPPGVHGGLSLTGLRTASSSKLPALEHLAQWWTARHGGVGHNFFADADHQVVQFRSARRLPMRLDPDSPPEDFAPFSALLVYGEGPAPPTLAGFSEVDRSGAWRRLERPGSVIAPMRDADARAR